MPESYHHGDLRAAVLAEVERIVARQGVAGVSIRALAASLGVSHTAPRHHFGSRDGVLTAFAAQGYGLLAADLRRVREGGGSFLDVGVGYVRFALDHPAHFAVMFDSEVLVEDDAALTAARDQAMAELRTGVQALTDPAARADMAAATVAGWSLMHGLVALARSGVLDLAGVRDLVEGGDLVAIARRAGSMLYGSPATRAVAGQEPP